MEFVLLGAFVLALYLLVRYAAKLAAGISSLRHRAYSRLAQRYRGRYEHRGLVDPPTVSFTHNGSALRVGLAPVVPNQPMPPRTRVVARFGSGLPFRCELSPVGRPQPTQSPRGTRPIKTEQADFDSAYAVQANDGDIARDLFIRTPVRTALDTLRRLGPNSGMLVSINPERLLVQVDRDLGRVPDALDLAVQQALIIHDALRESVAARVSYGVDIVNVGATDAAGPHGPPICEVCSEPISTVHVVCAVCKTPFHRDCWTFVGGCSTYGCSSKQCVGS